MVWLSYICMSDFNASRLYLITRALHSVLIQTFADQMLFRSYTYNTLCIFIGKLQLLL